MHLQEISIQLHGLKDLTQRAEDADKPLPYAWVKAFETVLAGEASYSLPDPTESDGRLHALIPNTKVIIKVKPAMWEAIKALAASMLTYTFVMKGDLLDAGVTATGVADALRNIKNAVDRLDSEKGELCCYQVVVQEGVFDIALKKVVVSDKLFAQAHRKYGKTCSIAPCMYHNGRSCNIPDAKRMGVVNGLVNRGILQKSGDKLWPIF